MFEDDPKVVNLAVETCLIGKIDVFFRSVFGLLMSVFHPGHRDVLGHPE